MINKNLLIAVLAVMAFSCGSKQSRNGLLAEIPSIMKEKHEQVERLQADMAEASEKNDVPKMKELLKEALSINAMYKQNLARIEKDIVGKKIPVAIAYNLCLKMDSGLVVRKVKGADPMIYCTGQATLTEAGSFLKGKTSFQLNKLAAVLVDHDGKPISSAVCEYTVPGSFQNVYSRGTIGDLNVNFVVKDWNAEAMSHLDHVLITMTNRDDYINAKNIDKRACEAFKTKNKQNL